MAMPATGSDESGKHSLYPDGDPDRHKNLTTCSVPAFREDFMQIHSGAFCAKFVRDKQTDKQTSNDENITLLVEVINWLHLQPMEAYFLIAVSNSTQFYTFH